MAMYQRINTEISISTFLIFSLNRPLKRMLELINDYIVNTICKILALPTFNANTNAEGMSNICEQTTRTRTIGTSDLFESQGVSNKDTIVIRMIFDAVI